MLPPETVQYFALVQVAVRRARPSDPRDGADLVRDAMALVANDGCQRADTSEDGEGYVDDARSVRTLRLLLAALYPAAAERAERVSVGSLKPETEIACPTFS